MHETQIQNIKQILGNLDSQYYKLILLIGESKTGKTSILKKISQELDLEILNINLSLSEKLIEYPTRNRVLKLYPILDELLIGNKPLYILDNIEVLFDKSLQLDPLKFLQNLSRNCTILSSWNGKIVSNHLTYAIPQHSEYHQFELSGFSYQDLNTYSAEESN
jgi:hypothetical protein